MPLVSIGVTRFPSYSPSQWICVILRQNRCTGIPGSAVEPSRRRGSILCKQGKRQGFPARPELLRRGMYLAHRKIMEMQVIYSGIRSASERFVC